MRELSSSGYHERIFHHFGRWPFVPAEDLLKLRQSLRQAQSLGGRTGASELLLLVDEEVDRRRGGARRDDEPSGDGAGAN